MISLRLPHETIKQLDGLATANGISKTAVMVEAVDSLARGGLARGGWRGGGLARARGAGKESFSP